jgi:hypothetical protein
MNLRFLCRYALLLGCFALAGSGSLPAQAPALASADSSANFSNFQNASVSSILDTYEEISGKHLEVTPGITAG